MSGMGRRVAAVAFATLLATSGAPMVAIAETTPAEVEATDETALEAAYGEAPSDDSGEMSEEALLSISAGGGSAYGAAEDKIVGFFDERHEWVTHECRDVAELPDVEGVTLSDGWYAVRKDKSFSEHCLSVTGSVNLVLCDGATLTCSHGIKNRGSLTVWAQSDAVKANKGKTGRLVATGGEGHAGIGGWARGESGGTVTIRGGFIEAHGGTDAAGIGGAFKGDGGTITISGGDVEAHGNDNGAGIGGGDFGDGGTINISGGSIHAYGGQAGGAGIGGGNEGNGGHIIIHDGTVEAYGGHDWKYSGAGIGGGDDGFGGDIEIFGGDIYAESTFVDWTFDDVQGAGIGGGDDGDSGLIRIHSGCIRAKGYEAIGCGEDGSTGRVMGHDNGVRIDYDNFYFNEGNSPVDPSVDIINR